MSYQYIKDPLKIEQDSFKQIRELTDLQGLSVEQQQVVMRVVHSVGIPRIAEQVRFSDNACQSGMQALQTNSAASSAILCDVEMVKQGLTKRMIPSEPLCFLNDPQVATRAKELGETRTMAAVEGWKAHLQGSVILIGNAPTALFRLLEILETTEQRPALIIGMPVGFIGAAESKQALWDAHQRLGVECITLLGREGGSAVTAATFNALLRCLNGELY